MESNSPIFNHAQAIPHSYERQNRPTLKTAIHFINNGCFFLFVAAIFLTSYSANGQCSNASAFGTITAPSNNTPVTITTCAFAGEYSTINSCVSGSTYLFSASGGAGNYLTIRQGTPGGTVLGFGFSPISVVCTVSGPLYLHYNTNASCGTDGSCHTGVVQCTSCAGAPDPCSSITTLVCANSVTAALTGPGLWSPGSCGFSTPGTEKIYSFTAAATGVHTLQVTSTSSTGFIDYFYKAASGGCNATGWTCIDDIFSPATATIGTLTAGTTYYILLDPETTSAVSHTFMINCPAAFDPCTTIPILTCATAVAATSSGTGVWSPNSCGFTTPGRELVYSFTPVTTGVHTLQVNSATGGFVDYFYKAASSGCNATGWLCIDDISSPGSATIGTLTTGTAYYILLDPEVTGVINHNFQINCPPAGSAPPCLALPTSPTNGGNAGCPNTTQTLSWPVSSGATSYDVYFGTSPTPPFVATTASTSYLTSSLAGGTYYWQIRPVNAFGTATGCTIWSFTKSDIIAPTIFCPPNVTANTSPGLCSAIVTYGSISATDNCNAPNIVQLSGPSSGSVFPSGVTTVSYRATDAAGNSSTCSFTVTVVDNQPPTINCPANVTASAAPGLCSAVVTYGSISATDNCSAPSITLISGLPSGSTFPVGITTIVYRASDSSNNTSTCSFTVTVRDLQVPTITCPGAVTVQCASLVPPVNTGNVTATDNCGPPTVTFVSDVISNQTCTNRYTLTRTYRATDPSGNSATCAQIITVFDNIAPVITFTDPLLEGVPNGGTIYIQCYGQDEEWELPSFSPGSVSTSDNCNGAVSVIVQETLQDEGNCAVDGYINLYRHRWTATDACGNSSTATIFVALVDDVPPVIHGVPEDIEVNCDEVPAPPDNIYATDECLCACVILYAESNPAPGCRDGQVITRSWTAIDDCGNQTVEKQQIKLIDDKGPELHIIQSEIANLPDGTILEYTCNEGGIPAFYNNLNTGSVYSAPTCGTAGTISFDEDIILSNNCDYFGYIEERVFTWEAVDLCGNKTSLTLKVHLIDDQPPVLIGVPEMTCIGDPALNEIEAVDNCENGSVRYWDVPIPSPCGNGNAWRRTYEGFDPCGNVVRDTAILLADNNSGPSIIFTNPALDTLAPGEILIINCRANENNYTAYGTSDIKVDDDCLMGLDVRFQETVIQPGDCNADNGVLAVLQLQWTASDQCGNTSQQTIMAHVMDQTPPGFVNFQSEVTIGCLDAMPAYVAFDNCGEVLVTTSDNVVPGECPYEYDIMRTVTASDPCGNTTSLLQTIHVGDGNGPVIEGIEEAVCNSLALPEVTAYDQCADQYVQVTMHEEQLNIPCQEGTVIERTWSAVDACGNVAVKHQRIIMNDQTPPVILIPTNSVLLRFIDTGLRVINLSQERIMDQLNDLDSYSIFVEDECDEAIIPAFSLDVSYAEDCTSAGYFERRVYTWVATDVCGNSSVLSISVDIMDDIAPVISEVPAETTIICGPLPAPGTVQTDDYTQSVSTQYSQTMVPGNGPGEFNVTRLWVATDACGNTSAATQHITWIPDTQLSCDIFLPQFVDCNSHDVGITSGISGGLGDISYEWEIFGEKCFIQSGQGTPALGMYIGWSEVEITLTLTDAYGCSTSCSATLDCEDLAPQPIVSVPGVSNADATYTLAQPVLIPATVNTREEELKRFNLWPNPANESIQLGFEAATDLRMSISLVNFLGQVILAEEMNVIKGSNSHRVDVSQIPEGGYLLQLKTKQGTYTKVVMVIRNE